MIVVRDTFRLKFGKAKEARALILDSKKLMDEKTQKNARAMFDLVGPAYTLVWEISFKNLTDFESEMGKAFGNKEWGEWYQKFIPLVESSYKEIFTVVE